MNVILFEYKNININDNINIVRNPSFRIILICSFNYNMFKHFTNKYWTLAIISLDDFPFFLLYPKKIKLYYLVSILIHNSFLVMKMIIINI
jgi:hypothetical protein